MGVIRDFIKKNKEYIDFEDDDLVGMLEVDCVMLGIDIEIEYTLDFKRNGELMMFVNYHYHKEEVSVVVYAENVEDRSFNSFKEAFLYIRELIMNVDWSKT